jgi:hypothetical protein
MVTINPATASAPQTKFTNLPAFRAGQNTLNLYTTHAGYLTTPSFLAQWPTNVSNSSRATINQAMIVGLGGAIGEDRITPLAKQPSVDAVHSADAACFNCHQDLDPMRQFYRQSFSLFNGPQKDPNQMNMPAKFAYGGVVADGAGVGDLAKIIAGHPLFALAWAQKVCTWATSSPCLESDPELKRIANAFAANNFQFPALVKDIMLSPLVTYRQATQTTATLGQMSALVRRNQLCDLLEQTTGLGDVCGRDQVQNSSNYDVPSLAQSIPGDQYGRGANNPLYVVQPDAIIRSSLENLCTLVADQMAREGVSVPMAQADPNVAIPALVHDLMGIGPAEDSGPIAILQQHYADVLAAKQPESVAWQSTFTLACVSPFVAATSQ